MVSEGEWHTSCTGAEKPEKKAGGATHYFCVWNLAPGRENQKVFRVLL